MPGFKIAAFYRFADLPDCREWAGRLRAYGGERDIKGTIILAPEGINSTCAGSAEAIDALLDLLKSDLRMSPLEAKFSSADFNPFPRFKVRVKKEIVTFRQPGADPREAVGGYLEPGEWNAMIADPETLVIDTRNDYEVRVGRFEGAVNPGTGDFVEFADYVERELSAHKDRPVAMYCTGGIRCERATAYLRRQGFEKVYHLKGGILRYLEEVPKEDSLWRGDCFVFDYRVAVDHDLEPAHWKIDPESGDPVPMEPGEYERIAERRRSGAIFEKPYRD